MAGRNISVTSPKGTAIWPRLNEPDRKFQPEGVYSVRLRLDEDEAAPFQTKLAKLVEELYKEECAKQGKKSLKRAPMPWGPATDYDKDTESRVEVDGTEFKFSMKAEVTTRAGKKWSQRPALFDSKLQPVPEDSDHIGGGSIIRVSAEVYPWYTASLGFGISLRPRAVQVLELRAGGSSSMDPAALGFQEEDGYTTVSAAAGFGDEDADF